MNGTDLLAEFRATRAEGAFSELVRRYTNLVYSIAQRRMADTTLAQEVSQIVFIRLAKAPPKLASEGQLLGWLHRTTVHASIDLWRSETRRRAREQHAVVMQTNPTEEVAWNEMSPVLDEALNELEDAERQVILLRFFEQKTMADLARILDVSEDAAKMRVSRAIGRLRTRLSGLGATCSAALLGTLLYERSVEAAPNGLAATLAAIRIAAPAGLAGGLINLMFGPPGAKLVSTLAAAIVVGGTALFLMHTLRRNANPGGQAASDQAQNGFSNAALAAANSDTNDSSNPVEVNATKLIQAAARARQRIASGIIDFEIFTSGTVTRVDDTNWLKLKVQFEDGRLWAESTGQEFSYVTPIPGGPEAEAITKRADQMPRSQAIQEGLIQAFPSHHVAFYDGQAVTDYWESDYDSTNRPHYRTDIRKPGSSSIFIFDPRCLGISTTLFVESKVEDCLPYSTAKSVTLLGRESVDGKAALHIQVRNKYDYNLDYWIDAFHSARVLKVQANGDIALSRYSNSDLKDPLPIEVRNIHYQNGIARYETRVVRLTTRYNAPIDPVNWTLDGLHMKIGTEVSDSRNYRLLGYWTGAGLSDNLPRNDQPQLPAPNRAELLTLLENEPASPAALGAALWILTNSPDGPDLQKAANVLLESHIQNPELAALTQELERMRPSCSSNLLQAMLDQNPNKEVRGKACMALATMRKDAAGFGTNTSATAEAEKLYERVIAEFGSVQGQGGKALAELARPELSELRKLAIGKVAPEINGSDLFGGSMKLSDYRGRVVTLLFWSAPCFSEYDAREFNRLVEQMDGKAFALIGIHADDNPEKAKTVAEKFEMKWPSFADAREGPISKTYNINSWPTIYVLDRKGVIRYRGLYQANQIPTAAEKLLNE
jgi:RNA polymerase sigma factor (sigma-70 family)